MSTNTTDSVAINELSNSEEKPKFSEKEALETSAALVIDAKEGLLLLSKNSDNCLNTRLYFLYRNSILQFILYFAILLNHSLILFEDYTLWNLCLEIICLLIYLIRSYHLLCLTPPKVFWVDTKNIIVITTVFMTFIDLMVSLSISHYIRWTPVLRPLFIINFAENKQVFH